MHCLELENKNFVASVRKTNFSIKILMFLMDPYRKFTKLLIDNIFIERLALILNLEWKILNYEHVQYILNGYN